MSQDAQRNQVVCGECGEIRLETPPGTSILPTLGMAKKAAGTAGACDCGRRPEERPGGVGPEESGGVGPEEGGGVGPEESGGVGPQEEGGGADLEEDSEEG